MNPKEQVRFAEGDTVLARTPGLRKRVLQIIIPEISLEKGLLIPGDSSVEIVLTQNLLLIEPAKARRLSVVSEAQARSKAQWGEQTPPYMQGVPYAKTNTFVFDDEEGVEFTA